MINDFWGYKKLPFNNVPDPDFFFPSKVHKEALGRISYTVHMSQGIAVLTGEVGCGKTILSRIFINNLSDSEFDIALIINPMLPYEDFLKEILYQLGMQETSDSKIHLLHTLNDRIMLNTNNKKNTVIIIDEAQLIENNKIFEELRLLLNFQTNSRFLLTLILIGQEELRENIAGLSQLDQRVAVRYHLSALDKNNTFHYILHRIKVSGIKKNIFSQDACNKIYDISQGIPRKINNICSIAMNIGEKIKKNILDSKIIEYAAKVSS